MKRYLALLAVSAVAVAGCGGDDDGEDAAGDRPAAPAAEPAEKAPAEAEPRERPKPKGTKIAVGDSQYGEVLFGGDGQAIYAFDMEKGSTPECYDDCAAAWPPVLTKGGPQAAKGAREGLLGTTERRDGKQQVTYDGKPIYYYANESPNEVRCHNVPGFGGLWLALKPSGDPPS